MNRMMKEKKIFDRSRKSGGVLERKDLIQRPKKGRLPVTVSVQVMKSYREHKKPY